MCGVDIVTEGEGGREGGKEGGKEGGRDGRREGGREREGGPYNVHLCMYVLLLLFCMLKGAINKIAYLTRHLQYQQGLNEEDVFVCESSYSVNRKSFRRLKVRASKHNIQILLTWLNLPSAPRGFLKEMCRPCLIIRKSI